jgi:ceramide glucosyltransferase
MAAMTTLMFLAVGFCLFATVLHASSIAVATARMRKPRNAQQSLPRPPEHFEPVTILRPVCGIENFALETLASSFFLDYPRYELLFCVPHANDPVIPLIERLVAAYPRVPARLLIGNECISSNPKLNNLVKGWAAANHSWIVMADSNVLMPPDYLQRLFAAWQDDTGLVCSPPAGQAPDGIWAELECGFLNSYQARWQLFADAIGSGFAQGKSMLWRREVLAGGGGIRALGAEAAEDAAATKLVNRQGLRVRLVDRPFGQPLGYRSAKDVWRRQLRWARLRRDTFKWFFVAEILAGGLPPLLAVVGLAAVMDGPVAGATAIFVAGWYGAEAVLSYQAGWPLSWCSVMVWMLRDLLLPVLWCASWAGNGFAWRGNAVQIANRSSPA